MRKRTVIIRILASIGVILYLIFMPGILRDKFSNENRSDEQTNNFTGVINIWHIVTFKPYSGSISEILKEAASDIEKNNFGVYFEVCAMDEAEYRKRIENGEKADIYSFPCGALYADRLSEIDVSTNGINEYFLKTGMVDSRQYALPYAYSAYTLLINTNVLDNKGVVLPENGIGVQWLDEAADTLTYTYGKKSKAMAGICGNEIVAAIIGIEHEIAGVELFKSGDAAMAIGDLRLLGDMERLVSAGKGFTYEAYPLSEYTDLVQYIGFADDISSNKKKYASEFVEALFSEKTMSEFIKRLVFSTVQSNNTNLSDTIINSICEKLENAAVPNTFLYNRYRDKLGEAAKAAVLGDENSRSDFMQRALELVDKEKIQ